MDIEIDGSRERTKLILQLMWPALAENVLATLVSMADTMMVSTLGTTAVAAVGLVTQPRFIMMSAFMALGTGATALVARAKGKGDVREANQVLRQALILAAVVVAILCTVMILWCEPLIRFIAGANISEETVQLALDYFRIQVYGFPTLALTFIMNACLRGAGNTRAAFYSNTASNIVNVIFNYLLIGGNFGFPASCRAIMPSHTATASLRSPSRRQLCASRSWPWARILPRSHSRQQRRASSLW